MKKQQSIFAYPTESFYAIGVDARDKKAIAELFRLKQREKGKPVALVAANLAQVKKFFVMSSVEMKLAKTYWPGGLTILLKPKKPIAARALGATRIGVRVPAHAGARRLAARLGAPITATSANISGQAATKSATTVKHDFPGILMVPGKCGRAKKPSTVVSVTKGKITIIRPGAIKIS